MTQNIPVYRVNATDLSIVRSRIEDYQIESYMFLDRDKALHYAHQIAQKYQARQEGAGQYATVTYNENGNYNWYGPNDYWPWPEFAISFEESVLNFDQDIINTIVFK